MKKKQNSLLDKLKQENQVNSTGSNVLSDISSLIPKLTNGSVLKNKIEEIKKLQKDNRLDSSNKIFEILNTDFQYSYPFYYRIGSHGYQLSKTELNLSDNLKNHIRRETQLNSVKPNFDKAKSYIDRKARLHKEKTSLNNKNEGLWNGCAAIFGYIFVALIIVLIIGDFYPSFANTVIWIGIVSVIGIIIWSISSAVNAGGKGKEMKELDKLLDREMSILKTKANTV